MQKLISIFFIILFSMCLITNDAFAKRFGGGKSFGVSRPAATQSHHYSRNNMTANKPSLGSRLLGPIAGLITGGLLASLLMGHGLAGGMISWLVLGLAAFFLFKMFAKKRQSEFQPSNNSAFSNQQYFNQAPEASTPTSTFRAFDGSRDFDQEVFLRDAKKQFIRLQAAYDEKNLVDLKRFTSPEVYAEIRMQLEERGDKPNQTDVLALDATFIEVTNESSDEKLASVKFSGTLREDHGTPENFTETWHFRKSSFATEWVVAGIEQ